jgi:hypothetical protein
MESLAIVLMLGSILVSTFVIAFQLQRIGDKLDDIASSLRAKNNAK